jgi:hypothetical protein
MIRGRRSRRQVSKTSIAPARASQDVPTRHLTVLAQDPTVRGPGGKALTTRVKLPAERLEPGPMGHRVHVIDYDATTDTYYRPRERDLASDPYEEVTDIDRLVGDPQFHQQNVYAIVMATMGEFEVALGRPLDWGFNSPAHQLKVAPHAFAEANAYYSRDSESLCFGYFAGTSGQTVFTCLSHDVVAHETSHALLDGLRSFYLFPSHVDQAAFHEGFSDLVALLSVLKSSEVLEHALGPVTDSRNLVRSADLSRSKLAAVFLFRLAEQFGRELDQPLAEGLRHSIGLEPSPQLLQQEQYQEPHRRGEIVVAAVLGSFLSIWEKRLDALGRDRNLDLNRTVVCEEGATAAKQLLRILIRALDYMPPVDMRFGDYLSAVLTADQQLVPDDGRFHYRDSIRAAFAAFGILPGSSRRPDGAWEPPPADRPVSYDGLHFELLRQDPNAAFRFIWENRDALGADPDAFTRVTAMRPCTRVSADGFVLRESLVEYVQTLQVQAYELKRLGIRKPVGLSGQETIRLYGGGTLIFDEFGHLKFHIGTGVRSRLQSDRLESLLDRGDLSRDARRLSSFAQLHRRRLSVGLRQARERW